MRGRACARLPAPPRPRGAAVIARFGEGSRLKEHPEDKAAGETRVIGYRQTTPGDLVYGDVLLRVYRALQEKGYDPVRQLSHFLLSGEPAYITAHQNARSMIAHLERDEVIAELVRVYLRHLEAG